MSPNNLLVLVLLFAAARAGGAAPDWYKNPTPDGSELLYERGSADLSPSKEEAEERAYQAALRAFANRICVTVYSAVSDHTVEKKTRAGKREATRLSSSYKRRIEVESNHQLIGTDIVRAESAEHRGTWSAWCLVSYPRVQYDKALERVPKTVDPSRAEDLSDERVPVLVCPMAFGQESEEQFPEVVASFKKKGYGNAIWQHVEDKLYATGRFIIVTPPSPRVQSMLEQILNRKPDGQSKLPGRILLCNVNFFEMKNESLGLGRLARNVQYHVSLMIEYYDVKGRYQNVKIPAKGEARHADLLAATDQAAQLAVDSLVKRIGEQP